MKVERKEVMISLMYSPKPFGFYRVKLTKISSHAITTTKILCYS